MITKRNFILGGSYFCEKYMSYYVHPIAPELFVVHVIFYH